MSALPPPPGTSPSFPPSDLPPPPAGVPSVGPSVAPSAMDARPPWVTAAGSILIVLGALEVLVGIVLALSRDAMGVEGFEQDTVVAVGVASAALGALEILAGILVLRRSNVGRVLGIALAGLGLLGGIAALASEPTAALGLVLNGLVLYGLLAYTSAFRARGGG